MTMEQLWDQLREDAHALRSDWFIDFVEGSRRGYLDINKDRIVVAIALSDDDDYAYYRYELDQLPAAAEGDEIARLAADILYAYYHERS